MWIHQKLSTSSEPVKSLYRQYFVFVHENQSQGQSFRSSSPGEKVQSTVEFSQVFRSQSLEQLDVIMYPQMATNKNTRPRAQRRHKCSLYGRKGLTVLIE